jgi:MoxR-like ATPase
MCSGSTGVGKSASAHAFANELGCYANKGWGPSCYTIKGKAPIDEYRSYFERGDSPLQFIHPNGWKVVVIEELERVHPDIQVDMQVWFDPWNLPPKTIVVATSNDPFKLNEPCRDRFSPILHYSGGPEFGMAALDRVSWIWSQERPDQRLPIGWGSFGWEGETFSMRRCLAELEAELVMADCEVAA